MLNLVEVGDVYMTFFLPETVVGRVALGSDVRIILVVAPEYVIPANASFVADTAGSRLAQTRFECAAAGESRRAAATMNANLVAPQYVATLSGVNHAAREHAANRADRDARLANHDYVAASQAFCTGEQIDVIMKSHG